MTKYKAIELALKIQNICKKNEDRCLDCPFNFNGCIVTDGDGCLPSDWNVREIISKGIKEMMTK